MGVMDIASGRRDFIEVTQRDDVSTRVDISGFGNNAVQSVFVNITNVESSCLTMLGEGAVTNVQFEICRPDETTTPASVSPSASSSPIALPSSVPTNAADNSDLLGAPTGSPSNMPSNVMSELPSDMPSSDPTSSANSTIIPPTFGNAPSVVPSDVPSVGPDVTSDVLREPSSIPSDSPSIVATNILSDGTPSIVTSEIPSDNVPPSPSMAPSEQPSVLNNVANVSPSMVPSDIPSNVADEPSEVPSDVPSAVENASSANPSAAVTPTDPRTMPPSALPAASNETATTEDEPSSIPSEAPSSDTLEAPSMVPSDRPSVDDTFSAIPSDGPSVVPEPCLDPVRITFETAGNNTFLQRGDYVGDDWLDAFGMSILATSTRGGFTPGGKARIFDTSNPEGDFDLGSPHRLCPGGGVGAGQGGRPGTAGSNCVPQGNVLIIQESDKAQPDDNAGGGMVCFEFEDEGVTFVSMGLMDIATNRSENRSDFLEITQQGNSVRIEIDGLGSNAVQSVAVNRTNVERACYGMLGEGAITYVEFCPSKNNNSE